MNYYCYPMAMERVKAIINSDDIKEAIILFEMETGNPPAGVFVAPKILERIVAENIDAEIIPHSGVATWEIWCGFEKTGGETILKQRETHYNQNLSPSNDAPMVFHGGKLGKQGFLL